MATGNESKGNSQKRSLSESLSDDEIDENELLKSDSEDNDDTGRDSRHDATDDLADSMGNVNIDSISDEESGDEQEAMSEPKRGLKLRDYQVELAENAIQQQNTIVHAATGAGKTRVALYIVKDHLDKKPEGKVAFMADKNFLVSQHHRSLKKILPEIVDKTVCLSAQKDNSDGLHILIDNYQIFLLTPAIIENTLKSQGMDFLSKFTMLVFDECHHTKKNSAYNRLMRQYHLLKEGGNPVPQILGLTATLGAQKANSVQTAVERGITVMANLDVTKLSTVVKHTAEYDKFRKDINQETIPLPEVDETNPVYKAIETAMDKTENLIVSFGAKHGGHCLDDDESKQLNATLSKKGTNKSDPSYITWTSELSNIGTTLLGRARDIGNALTVGSDYLKTYHEVICVNDELTAAYALQSVRRKLEGQGFGVNTVATEGSFEFQLANIAKDLVSEMERCTQMKQVGVTKKIDTLLKIIRDIKDKSTRFIVLVKTREVADMLTGLLKEEGVKCAAFTGATASSDVGGTSRADQEKAVKDFNSGELTGLIATNILEEGLDIPDCENVINYYYIGNEISTRQTAGRIRKMKGQVYVLATAKDCKRHSVNIYRGKIMDTAVHEILNLTQEELMKHTKRIIAKLIEDERQRNNEIKQPKRPRLANSRFKMVCRACGVFQVDCSTIRSIENSHHAAIDPSILKKKTVQPFTKKKPKFGMDIDCEGKMFGNWEEKKDIVSRHCKHELGIVSKYKNVRLPFISYKLLAVLDTRDNRTSKLMKWAEVPFEIPAITEEDLDIMRTPIDE